MKTFENEFAELADWIRKKNNEYIEKMKKEIGKPGRGHDSKLTYEHTQDVQEYNRRLTELKVKYGKDKTVKKSDLSEKSERIHI